MCCFRSIIHEIELRIVAHMSGDQAMLDAFRAGEDIHAATAAAIYKIPLKDVNKDQRRHAKAINFGLIYGMSPFGLSRSNRFKLWVKPKFRQGLLREFPWGKSYLDNIRGVAARQGYVETMLGRRRLFPNLANPANVALRNREEREAIKLPFRVPLRIS